MEKRKPTVSLLVPLNRDLLSDRVAQSSSSIHFPALRSVTFWRTSVRVPVGPEKTEKETCWGGNLGGSLLQKCDQKASLLPLTPLDDSLFFAFYTMNLKPIGRSQVKTEQFGSWPLHRMAGKPRRIRVSVGEAIMESSENGSQSPD